MSILLIGIGQRVKVSRLILKGTKCSFISLWKLIPFFGCSLYFGIGVIIYLLMRDRRRRRTSWQGSPSMPAADQPLPRGMQQPVALNPKQVKDRAVVRIALGLGLAAVSYYYDWHLLLAVGLLLVIVYAVKYYMACRDQQNDRRDE